MILGQEGDSEFVINRQNAKIQFLQNENNQLQEDNQDLQRALVLNKDALKLAYEQNFKQSHPKSFQSKQESTVLHDHQDQFINSSINEILDKQIQENKILLQTYKRCLEEKNELTTQNLLHSQINEQSQKFYKDIIHDLEEKVLELRRIIQDKEYTIQTLEKKITLPDQDEVLIKIKEIVSPNEQTIPLHAEIEKHKQLCKQLNDQVKKLEDENLELKESNLQIKFELHKYINCLQSPINYQNYKENLCLVSQNHETETNSDFYKNLFNQLINIQNNSQNSNIENSEYDKQKNFGQTILEQSGLIQSLKQEYQLQQQQDQNIQGGDKSGQLKSPRTAQSRMELLLKVETLESNVEKMKKLYFKTSKNNKVLIDTLLDKKTQINTLNLQIKTLQKSNRQYDHRFSMLQNQTNFYQQFFHSYLLDKHSKRRKSLDIDAVKFQKQQVDSGQLQQSDNNEEENNKIEHQQILDNILQDENKQENLDYLVSDSQELHELTKDTTIFMINKMNRDMKKIDNQLIRIINNQLLKIDSSKLNEQKRQRSLSDPLNYFNVPVEEKRQLIKQWQKNIHSPIKKQQQKDNNYDKQSTPFFLDMSVIGIKLNQNSTSQNNYNNNKEKNININKMNIVQAIQEEEHNNVQNNNNNVLENKQQQQQKRRRRKNNNDNNINDSFVSNEDGQLFNNE